LSKIKIAYVDFDLPYALSKHDYPAGGTAIEWTNWIHGFNQNKIDFTLISFKGSKNMLDLNLIEAYDLDKGIPKFRLLFYQFPMIFKAIKKSKATHVIQQNSGFLSGLVALSCLIQKKQFVYRVGSDIDVESKVSNKLGLIKNLFFQFAFSNANYIVCQNNYQYQKVKLRFSGKKIFTIYNPFNLDKIKKIKRSENRKYITWIGNFRPVKNIAFLYPIAKKMPNQKFLIIGTEFKNMSSSVRNDITRLKKLKNVEFTGYLSKNPILEILSKSYLLINTSKYEGFSNTFIEALSVGTPILTSPNANPDFLVSKNKLGLVVNYNTDDYVTSINKIIEETNYSNFYSKSLKFVMEKFDSKIQSNKLVNFLSK
jgi:glycosyltransferase involved in cell wall biosynthesis